METAKITSNYYQLLQTGLGSGKLVDMKWENVDFKKRTMEFKYGDKDFRNGEPKSKSSYMVISMTQAVYNILMIKKHEADNRKICSLL